MFGVPTYTDDLNGPPSPANLAQLQISNAFTVSGMLAKPFRTDPMRKLLMAGEGYLRDTTRDKPHNRRVPVAEFG